MEVKVSVRVDSQLQEISDHKSASSLARDNLMALIPSMADQVEKIFCFYTLR